MIDLSSFIGCVVNSIDLLRHEANPTNTFPARLTIKFVGRATLVVDVDRPLLVVRPDGSMEEGPLPVRGPVRTPGSPEPPVGLQARLSRARAARNRAHRAVTDWMDEQGRQGRLMTNGQAPGWAAYEAAELAWKVVLAEFDAGLSP